MSLPTKPWRPSFGPLPASLVGRIPVETPTERDIRRAANQHYIDETAAIAEETDESIARERAARLDETLNDAVIAARTGVLSASAARLLRACDTIFEHDARHGAPNKSTPPMLPASSQEPCSHGSGAVRQGESAITAPIPFPSVLAPRRADETSGGDRRPLPEVAYSGATKGGDHEDLAASGLPLSTPVGTLLQLRPGQGVPVFGDVAFDSRRA